MKNKTNYIYSRIFFVLIIFQFGCKNQMVDYPDSLKQVHQNLWDELLETKLDEDKATELLASISDSGTWSDVDYLTKQRGEWPTADHLRNTLLLAQAYQTTNSSLFHKKNVSKTIHKALNNWLENDYECPNWWYPQIGIPQLLGPLLILMESELLPEQKESGLKIISRAKIGMTGQNKVWLSGNVLIRGLLEKDESLVKEAANSIKEELKVGDGEGIQPDWSFHQHGPQQQFGNYGSAYAGSLIHWMKVLHNTPFAFSDEKVAILRNYLLKGLQWVVWKNRMDVSSLGRQLFVDFQDVRGNEVQLFFKQMAKVDPAFMKEYQKAVDSKSIDGTMFYRNSDYLVKRDSNYFFSVKMCSDRVSGAESCNNENISGYYMGDGVSLLYQTGDEYHNIFPYWDWKKIPGTTTLQDTSALPVLTFKGYFLESDFVGGVTNNQFAVSAMDYVRGDVKAKKSWFVFDNQIICLGAGINSKENFTVTTSLNQTYLKGPVEISTTKDSCVDFKGETILNNPQWVCHNHVGYYFPKGGHLKVEASEVEGSWHNVALQYKDEVIKDEIFKLYLIHGVQPVDQKYAYALYPNIDCKKLNKLTQEPSFEIIRNDVVAQAVVTTDEEVGGAVFYKAGEVNLQKELKVDQPCIIMLTKEKNGWLLSLADPTHKLDSVRLTLKGSYNIKHDRVSAHIEKSTTVFTVDMPQNQEAGNTIAFHLIN